MEGVVPTSLLGTTPPCKHFLSSTDALFASCLIFHNLRKLIFNKQRRRNFHINDLPITPEKTASCISRAKAFLAYLVQGGHENVFMKLSRWFGSENDIRQRGREWSEHQIAQHRQFTHNGQRRATTARERTFCTF